LGDINNEDCAIQVFHMSSFGLMIPSFKTDGIGLIMIPYRGEKYNNNSF